MNTASVIGLGNMGNVLARLLLRAGYRVTVYNRTPLKAAELEREGALVAASPAEAVRASDVIVVCVYDYAAARALLANAEVEAALAGRTVVQLTTGSPRDARDSEAWAHRHGAQYIDGAMQAAPAQMGQADTAILVSGAKPAFDRVEPLLKLFGGALTYLGEGIAGAAAMDLATLSYVYGATIGFIHGARIAEHESFPVNQFGEIVEKIAPAFGAFLRYEGNVISGGDFSVTQSPMSISVEATARILAVTRENGLDDRIPSFFSGILQEGKTSGYEHEEVAALIKLLRPATR